MGTIVAFALFMGLVVTLFWAMVVALKAVGVILAVVIVGVALVFAMSRKPPRT